MNHHHLVAHRRHISSSCCAASHHNRYLGYALGGHPRLVEKDSTEVQLVWEYIVLLGEEGARRVHHVDAREIIFLSYLLSTEVLFNGDWVVRATLEREVVGHDHALPAANNADSSDNVSTWDAFICAERVVAGELADLEERRARVQHSVYSLAGQKLISFV